MKFIINFIKRSRVELFAFTVPFLLIMTSLPFKHEAAILIISSYIIYVMFQFTKIEIK